MGLLGVVAVNMIVAMTLAFMLALLPCFFLKYRGGSSRRKRKEEKDRKLSWVILGCFFLLIGYGRGRQVLDWSNQERGLELEGTWQEIQGELLTIKQKGKYQILILENCVILKREGEEPEERETEGEKAKEKNQGENGERCQGKKGEEGGKENWKRNGEKKERDLRRLQVYLDQDHGISRPVAGSRLLVKGEIRGFSPSRNPGEFDYDQYYRSQKLHYRMFADSWQVQKQGNRWCREYLYRLSVYAGQILDEIADPEDAGIFRAAILGEKSQLDEEIRELYQKSGIAHLLAISGLHLSLISGAVYGTLRRLGAGYGKAGIFGGMFLILYAAMTGASPSVLRALIMALCGFLAAYLGRTYDLPSAWGLAAILLLWENPYYLCQAGVQLSFGAVAGIALVAGEREAVAGEAEERGENQKKDGEEERRERKAGKEKGMMHKGLLRLGEALEYSLGMQLVTLPMVLYHFFQVPLYGIFLNLLVVPLMGILVASGTAGILLGSLWLPAGRFAVGSGHVILKLYEGLCRLWEGLPGSCLILGRPGLWQIAVYFGVFAAAIRIRRKGENRYFLLLLMLLPLLLLQPPVRGMETTFLDVGQGDGICIRTQRTVILVDGGSTDQKNLGETRLEPFLKSKGIRRVDYAIVSHGDQDHISGLMDLLEENEIAFGTLVLPGMGRGEAVYEGLEELARQKGSTLLWMERGDSLKIHNLEITCRYPENQERILRDRNEHSLVLQVDYGRLHMLLTGDMSGEGEGRLMALEAANPFDKEKPGLEEIQILKIAHHGSAYSTTEEWLDHLSPDWAVISYGEGNRYGHPGEQVMENLRRRNVKIWETAKDGAISFVTDGRRIRWKSWIAEEEKE